MFKPTSVALDDSGTWPVLLPIGAHKHVPSFPIDGTTCLAGSRTYAQIVLNSPLVSKSHVLFVNDRGETYLRDLASTNGVYVNNLPIREARLTDGDILNIGRFRFICRDNFPGELEEEPDPAADAELLIEKSGQRAPIRLRTCVIGRRPNCDMQLNHDETVSPVHAVIYRCGGRRFLHDLNSREGTFLNHQRIRDAEVRPGDMIRVGATVIRFERATESARGGWVPAMAAEQAAPVRLADQDEGPIDPMTDSSLERALLMHDEIQVAAKQSKAMVGAAAIEPPPPQSMGEMKGLIDLFALSEPPMPAAEPGPAEVQSSTQSLAEVAQIAHFEPHMLVQSVEEHVPLVALPDLHKHSTPRDDGVAVHPDLIFEPELPPGHSQSPGHFATALDDAEEAWALNEVLAALQPAMWHEGPTARNVDLPHSGSSQEQDPYRRSADRPVGDFDASTIAQEQSSPEAALLDECFHQETGL